MATAAGSDSEEEGSSDDDDHKTLRDISRIEDLTVDEGIDDLIQGLASNSLLVCCILN